MSDIITAQVIPKYGQVLATAYALEQRIGKAFKLPVEEPERVVAIVLKIAREKLPVLIQLRDKIDLIGVQSLETTVLDNEMESVFSLDAASERGIVLGEELAVRFYTDKKEPHRGKMSPSAKSNAFYIGQVVREEEPTTGDVPVTMLLQVIPGGKETSHHYHKHTRELFLAIAGKAIIKVHRVYHKLKERFPRIEVIKPYFREIAPNTYHQLRALEHGAVNVLCMNPYDPELKDHFYHPDSIKPVVKDAKVLVQ